MITPRTDDEIKSILTSMGYKITLFDQDHYPIELMNDRVQLGGRFWTIKQAYKTALYKELELEGYL